MAIKQQYYTSCRTEVKTGYQVKAESTNFVNEERQILNQLLGYVIPSGVDVKAINTHPLALRYFVQGENSFLISSQSNGQDEFGRDGNFFAHSVVGSWEEIANIPPIFYWKSPFWVNRDQSNQKTLPVLEEFNPEIVFDFDSVWTFLNQNNRREWFYKLIRAVIDYSESKRKIIIIDDNEAIASWIACLSTVLHPRYVNYLSFATYHHDPYTAPFMITGTTEKSNFRCSDDEYFSYFIINTPQNRISDAPEFDFATYIYENLDEQKYESEILEFYDWLDRYDSDSHFLTKRLDDYTNFRRARLGKADFLDSSKIIQSAQTIIQEQSNKTSIDQYEEEDLVDLKNASNLLGQGVVQNQSSNDLLPDYISSLQTLKKIDSSLINQAKKDLSILISLVLQKREAEVKVLDSALQSIYTLPRLKELLNSLQCMERLAERLSNKDSAEVLIFWKYLGEKLNLSSQNQNYFTVILAKTFSGIPNQEMSKRLEIPNSALEFINGFFKYSHYLPKEFIIKNAIEYKKNYPNSPVFEWIYYELISQIPFQLRQDKFWQYWQEYSSIIPDLYVYELQRDILKSQSSSQAVDVIYSWLDHLKAKFNVKQDFIKQFTKEAIEFIWLQPQFNRQELAEKLLQNKDCETFLETDIYNQLIEDFLSDIELHTPNKEVARLYYKFLQNPSISFSQEKQIILWSCLDMFNNQITESNIQNYHNRYKKLSPDKYEQEVEKLLEKFFANKTKQRLKEEHFNVVQIAYVPKYRDLFWEMYWQNFGICLIKQKRVGDTIFIMDLWFNAPSYLAEKLGYFVPEFFINLLEVIEEMYKIKGFNKIRKDFESQVQNKDWYPIIEPIIEKQNQNIIDKFSEKLSGLRTIFKQ